MRVLIFEPDHSGHRLQYVRILAAAVGALPVELTIALSSVALRSTEFRTHLGKLSPSIRLTSNIDVSTRAAGVGGALRRLKWLGDAIAHCHAEHVFVPYGDGLVQVASAAQLSLRRWLPRGAVAEALLLNGGFAHREPNPPFSVTTRDFLLIGTLRWSQFASLHQLDPIAHERLINLGGKFRPILSVMPEPVEPMPIMSREAARKALNIPVDGIYASALGALESPRKATAQLAAAFVAVRRPKQRLLLLGKLSDQVRESLYANYRTLIESGAIIIRDQYASESEFALGLCASDLVCTPYLDFRGPSGIVVRAAHLGRPVLGPHTGWIGQMVSRFALGYTCTPSSPDSLAASLRRALSECAAWAPSGEALCFARFHTAENFGAHWTYRLSQRLGLPSPAPLGWELMMGTSLRTSPVSP